MKKYSAIVFLLLLVGSLWAANGVQPSYVTIKQSGTIMLSGGGFYSTDLGADLKASHLRLSTDLAMFIFPMIAAGVELDWDRGFQEVERFAGGDEVDEVKTTNLRWGPRAYFFLGGKASELTPFVKAGPNFVNFKSYLNDDVQREEKAELDLTASAGILLNLAKNVGISAEAEYNFSKGEEINTDQLFIKFTIRSFLGE